MSRVRGVTPKVPKVLKVLGDISGAGPRPFAWRRAGRVERDGCLYFEVSRTGLESWSADSGHRLMANTEDCS